MLLLLSAAFAQTELSDVSDLAAWTPSPGDIAIVGGEQGGLFTAGPSCTPNEVLTWQTGTAGCAYRQWDGVLLQARWAGLAFDGSSDDLAGLQAADAAASAAGAALVVASLGQTLRVGGDLTLLAPLVVTDSRISIDPGYTLTLSHPLTAGREHVFNAGWEYGTVIVPPGVWYPEWWGLIPNDEGDAYDGWLGMIESANAVGHDVTIEMRPGDYFIRRYRISGGPDANGYDPLRFDSIDHLTINGHGAVFHAYGAFHRRANAPNSKSYDNEIGLQFWTVSNMAIRDLTLLGHVEEMTRDRGVNEGGGNHGLYWLAGRGVLVERVTASGWAADGFYLQSDSRGSGPEVVPKDFLLRNVTAQHNRRQGMSIIQGYGIHVEGADFSYQGSPMAYGDHAPSAGVDIEPHQRPCDHPEPGGSCTDLVTGDILFDGLVTHGNKGFCFVAEDTNKIDDVTVRHLNCDVGADNPGSGGSAFLLSVRRGLIEDSEIHVRDRHWYLTFSNVYNHYASDTIARRVTVRVSGGTDAISKTGNPGLPKTVTWEGVNVIADAVPEPAWGSYLISLEGPDAMTWTGGRVFLPAALHDGNGVDYYVKIKSPVVVTDVTFATDLAEEGRHFGLSAGTATFCGVTMESPVNQIARGPSPVPTGTVYTDPACP